MGNGVFPVTDVEEIRIREQYKNGTNCGKVLNNNLMQYYIHDPLLVNGKKVDLRMFIIIASTNPMIAYFNDGYFTVSLADFHSNSSEKSSFLTNSDVTKKYFYASQEKGMFTGMTERDLWEQTLWTYETFQNYLLEQGIINDTNWVDNYLRPELQKLAIHLVRMSQNSFAKRSSEFEIFGVDVLIDANFNLWFLEANANPDIEDYPLEIDNLLKNMLIDSYEVQFGLLRSRTKRILSYINGLIRNKSIVRVEGNQTYLADLETRKAEFKKLTQNYFLTEFEPAPKARFPKIIDENLEGIEKYNRVLPYDCIDDDNI